MIHVRMKMPCLQRRLVLLLHDEAQVSEAPAPRNRLRADQNGPAIDDNE